MVRRRPDLFYAFVGTGQAVDMRRAEVLTYELALRQVRAAHEVKAAAQLVAAGPPPYSDVSRLAAVQRIESDHSGEDDGPMGADFIFAPGYSLRECFRLIVGATQHRTRMVAEDAHYNAASRGTRFDVPIFFFQGSDDIFAPLQLAAEYMDAISAPQKALVVIPRGGHNAFIMDSQRFLNELNARVRPIAAANHQL
jgi:pimeloyl-ACP methyl ester carboxylesterase